mmetsp:Transcript_27408/g.53186  ORF Transcript_27408/g.53186 Transcript_27408/m.53186 type:complete len:269 (-) Transcript_27408:281-1087(-)
MITCSFSTGGSEATGEKSGSSVMGVFFSISSRSSSPSGSGSGSVKSNVRSSMPSPVCAGAGSSPYSDLNSIPCLSSMMLYSSCISGSISGSSPSITERHPGASTAGRSSSAIGGASFISAVGAQFARDPSAAAWSIWLRTSMVSWSGSGSSPKIWNMSASSARVGGVSARSSALISAHFEGRGVSSIQGSSCSGANSPRQSSSVTGVPSAWAMVSALFAASLASAHSSASSSGLNKWTPESAALSTSTLSNTALSSPASARIGRGDLP